MVGAPQSKHYSFPEVSGSVFAAGSLSVQAVPLSPVESRDCEVIFCRGRGGREFLDLTFGEFPRCGHPIADMLALQAGQILDDRYIPAMRWP